MEGIQGPDAGLGAQIFASPLLTVYELLLEMLKLFPRNCDEVVLSLAGSGAKSFQLASVKFLDFVGKKKVGDNLMFLRPYHPRKSHPQPPNTQNRYRRYGC